MSEYVYCLSNPDYSENLYKIGFTTNNPMRRAEELYSTGVPSNFVIEIIIKTSNGKLLEKMIHNKLKHYRHNTQREFFRIPIATLKNIFENELHLNTVLNAETESVSKPVMMTFGECQIELPEKDNTTHYDCECGSNVCISNKARHLNSPLHLNFVNKVEPKAKASTIVNCGCGKTFSLKNKTHHNKTKYHLDYLDSLVGK
jgi:hypothetical protein